MEHYNEVAEAERRALARKIQEDFYTVGEGETAKTDDHPELFNFEKFLATVKENPVFQEQLLQILRNMRITT